MGFDTRVEATLFADLARVWDAIATDELAAWFWPPRFATVATLEPRPGGRLRIRSDAMDLGVTGSVVAVHGGAGLETTWCWDGETAETRVVIGVAAVDGATRITVDHVGFASQAEATDHHQGWVDCLGRLQAHLSVRR